METKFQSRDMSVPVRRSDGRALTRCPRFKMHRSFKFISDGAATEVLQAAAHRSGARVTARDDHNGVVRVKFVMTKKQLRQMVDNVAATKTTTAGVATTTLAAVAVVTTAEQNMELLLHMLRRRHMKRAESGKGQRIGRRPWQPALQSIPEEI